MKRGSGWRFPKDLCFTHCLLVWYEHWAKDGLVFKIYPWNPNDLYFWRSTPQNKAQTQIKTRGPIWLPGLYISHFTIWFETCLKWIEFEETSVISGEKKHNFHLKLPHLLWKTLGGFAKESQALHLTKCTQTAWQALIFLPFSKVGKKQLCHFPAYVFRNRLLNVQQRSNNYVFHKHPELIPTKKVWWMLTIFPLRSLRQDERFPKTQDEPRDRSCTTTTHDSQNEHWKRTWRELMYRNKSIPIS